MASGAINGIRPFPGGSITTNKPNNRRRSASMYDSARTGKDGEELILCADVDLVVGGVSKDATEDQLKSFITDNGITVIEMEKLTKNEEARTNAFRIRVKASDFDKAMKPEVWPYRVGVRHYIPPKRKQQTWQAQSAQSGGFINPPQQQRPGNLGGSNSYGGAGQGYQQQGNHQHLRPQVPAVPAQHRYHGQQPGHAPGPAQHGYPGQQPEQVRGPAQQVYHGQQPSRVQSYGQQFVQQQVPPVGQQYGVITQNRFAVEGFAGSNYSN